MAVPGVTGPPNTVSNSATSGYTVTVRSGDTLSGIATREAAKLSRTQPGTNWKSQLTYQAIAQYNHLDDANQIEIGQQIKIPDANTLAQIQPQLSAQKGANRNSPQRPRPSAQDEAVFREQLYTDAPVEIVEVNPNLLATDTAHVIQEVRATLDEQFPEIVDQLDSDCLDDAIAENLTDNDGDGKAELNLDMLRASFEARGVSVEPAFADNLSDALRTRGGLHEYIDDAKLHHTPKTLASAQRALDDASFNDVVKNPHDLNEVKAYFDSLRKGATAQVYFRTMQAYVQKYFIHVGADVNDNFQITTDTDLSRFAANDDGQVLIDCSMYADLYESLLQSEECKAFEHLFLDYSGDSGAHAITVSEYPLKKGSYLLVVTDNDRILYQAVPQALTSDQMLTEAVNLINAGTSGDYLVTREGHGATRAEAKRMAYADAPTASRQAAAAGTSESVGQIALNWMANNLDGVADAITPPKMNTKTDYFKRAEMIVDVFENGSLSRQNPQEEAAFELAYAMVTINEAQNSSNTATQADLYQNEVLPHLKIARDIMQPIAKQTEQAIGGQLLVNKDAITVHTLDRSIEKAQAELTRLQTPPELSYTDQIYNYFFGE